MGPFVSSASASASPVQPRPLAFCPSRISVSIIFRTSCALLTLAFLRSRGKYGEDYFTLAGTYFQGRPPKSVNFHWRRFRVADIPLDDPESFDLWLRERWYEKDALMEQYLTTGRFPGMAAHGNKLDYVETEVRTRRWHEFLQIFVVLGALSLVCRVLGNAWERLTTASAV